MTIRQRLYATLTLGLTLALPATRVDAQKLSDASRLGAFSGAMQYCAENHGGADRRYQRALIERRTRHPPTVIAWTCATPDPPARIPR